MNLPQASFMYFQLESVSLFSLIFISKLIFNIYFMFEWKFFHLLSPFMVKRWAIYPYLKLLMQY